MSGPSVIYASAVYAGRRREIFAVRDRAVFFRQVVKWPDGSTSYWAEAKDCTHFEVPGPEFFR